jgi:membrane protein
VTRIALGRRSLRRGLRALVDAYVENDLLTYASAISFQVLSAIVPFLLFCFGLLGFLSLEDVWREDLAGELRPNVSGAAFTVIDDVVETALDSRQLFWVTAGFLIALWQVSGAVRAVMGAMNRIYADPTTRSWGRRMLVSFALGLAVGACFLAAIVVGSFSPLLYGDVGPLLSVLLFLARWAVVGALLLVAVAVLVHYAPERHQPIGWVSFGSLLIMFACVYLRDVADYGSVFSNLATVVVLIGYLYATAVVFLGGVQVDALVRSEVSG